MGVAVAARAAVIFGGGGPRPMGAHLLDQGDVQSVGQEGDEDVGVDPGFDLVVDRPDRQIPLEVARRLFDLGQLQIVAPLFSRVAPGKVGTQQIIENAVSIGPALEQPVPERPLFRSLSHIKNRECLARRDQNGLAERA